MVSLLGFLRRTGVEKLSRCPVTEPPRPRQNDESSDDAHHRVEECDAEIAAGDGCQDRQEAGQCVRKDVEVSGAVERNVGNCYGYEDSSGGSGSARSRRGSLVSSTACSVPSPWAMSATAASTAPSHDRQHHIRTCVVGAPTLVLDELHAVNVEVARALAPLPLRETLATNRQP